MTTDELREKLEGILRYVEGAADEVQNTREKLNDLERELEDAKADLEDVLDAIENADVTDGQDSAAAGWLDAVFADANAAAKQVKP